MELGNKLKRLTLALSAIGFCTAVAAGKMGPTEVVTDPWYLSVGTSYAFVNGSNASGDIASSTAPLGTDYFVNNSNLHFTDGLTANASISRDFGAYLNIGLAYEFLKTNISPGNGIQGVGIDSDEVASYLGNLNINTFLFKGRLKAANYSLLGTQTVPFIGAGIGASNLYASGQQAITASSIFFKVISNHSVWQLAFSGELGLMSQLNERWSLDYGVRYNNYGRMNSGTSQVNLEPFTFKEAVSSRLYAIAPFVNIAYRL